MGEDWGCASGRGRRVLGGRVRWGRGVEAEAGCGGGGGGSSRVVELIDDGGGGDVGDNIDGTRADDGIGVVEVVVSVVVRVVAIAGAHGVVVGD